jgi:hypothetical protein
MPFATVWPVVVPVVLVVAVVIPPAVEPPAAPAALDAVAIVLGVVTVMTVVVLFGTVMLAPTLGVEADADVACPAMGVVVGRVVVGMEGGG